MTADMSQWNYEIPCILGGFHQLVDPTATAKAFHLGADEAERKADWFTNDHCLVRDGEGRLHLFCIQDPYPETEKLLYTLHPYLAHYVSLPGKLEFQFEGMALDESGGTRYLGAPYVVAYEGKYRMLFESLLQGHRALELAESEDLVHWQRQGIPILEELNESKRDPCILSESGRYLIYLCNPQPEGSSVELVETENFRSFTHSTCLYIPDGTDYGGLESPCVVHRNGLWYLFFTYAHRHYYETVVLVSDREDRFDMKNQVTTLHGHASEIFCAGDREYFTSCGPEDRQDLNRHGIEAAELIWLQKPVKAGEPECR